ncbi:outer membrane protein assembly factor BamE [Algihabitans albus]|uniref:outer membrane protein assembly factor BamE n=1 Tax=Algihabitans albus TaxID=2164067 RepID=UPI000E5CD809|nr:outer membrane protein assembly factor BamE [Algihabitans albus]
MFEFTLPHLRRLLFAGTAAFLLAGCAERVDVRGNLPDVEQVVEIQPGLSTRDDVVRILGTPSTLSSFQDRTWYYIGQRQEQFAFLRPDVTDRSVLIVTFDERGLVQETRLNTIEDGRSVDLVDRETPTEGRELTVLQQLFGNLGRFPGSTGE